MHTITTPRLHLVCFTHALMRAVIDAPQTLHALTGFHPAPDWPNRDIAEALPFIAAAVHAEPALEPFNRLIVLAAVDHAPPMIIGEIGFKSLPAPEPAGGLVAEVGYGIAASARNRGFATEALRAMCVWAFQTHRLSAVLAECLPDNPASAAVLRHAGFALVDHTPAMLRWRLPAPTP